MVGIAKDKWIATCVLVDKLDKVEVASLRKEIEGIGLSMTVMEELVSLLKLRTIEEYSEKLGANSEGVQEIRRLFSLLQEYGMKDWVEFDSSVVRGLAYYTGVVFEGFDRGRELRAICGGGRYDKLLESFGSEAIPAVGFGFGDAVIVELLKMKNLLPDFRQAPVDCVVYAMKDSLRSKILEYVQNLRSNGFSVDVILDERKPKWVFQRADKMQIRHVIVLGEDEDLDGEVTIKDMTTGKQERCKYDDIVSYLSDHSKP
jgi:histidyl-tRNA synthetase